MENTNTENTAQNHILGLTQAGLIKGMQAMGIPKFRSKQIWNWVYKNGVTNLEDMKNISKKDAAKLAEEINFFLPEVATEQKSSDGTIKWLFKMHDGHEVETVYIPDGNRGTLCVSSQVGCTLNCRFCHTGTQGLSRNLTTSEIVSQVYLAKLQLNDFNTPKNSKNLITNVVYMGMGEPLYNWDNVKGSIKILMDSDGIGLGGRKITLSTSGMVQNLPEVGELGVDLAISLHAPDDETRSKIMPINKKWHVKDLMAAIRNFPLREHRRITWEYIMLDGVNDSLDQARNLVKLIEDIPSFVNIIPFNEWPGSPFKRSKQNQIEKFAAVLMRADVPVNVRRSRGEDILAACGQLRGESSKFNTISLQYPSVVAQYGTDKQKLKVEIKPNDSQT